ncbi:nascent polypeptide-associated complex protein [Candidatus Woesearchaeota archaeon]|nr:nascent polypeptide-associated complex protein [Candidatus Woesearchaeota archaeon]
MLPGLNPKQVEQAMKKLGIKQENIDAYEVVIKTDGKNLVIRNPNVTLIKMPGNESIQITGDIEEESVISEDDVNTVAEQAKVSKDEARNALERNNGDLAAAIMELNK